MEHVRDEVLQQFDDLSIENCEKSEVKLIFEGAFVRLRNELEKRKQENEVLKSRLESMRQRLEEKFIELQDDILEFEFFSDVGISCVSTNSQIQALVEAIQCFRSSIEEYEHNQGNMSKIERVQIDASRLLSIVHNQIRAKIQLCSFGGDEYVEFQKLAELLEDSIHIMNSKISTQNVLNIDSDELSENMTDSGKYADDLLVFLKDVQEQQRKIIDDKLTLDTSEEALKSITEKTRLEDAMEIEKEVGKSIDKFVKTNRNKSSLTLEDVRKVVVEVNGIWKNSYDQEIEKHREDLKNMINNFENQLEEWKTQRRTNANENRRINEWKEPLQVSNPRVDQKMKNTNYDVQSFFEPNSSQNCKGIIRKFILNVSKLDDTGVRTKEVNIGQLTWVSNIFAREPGCISCVLTTLSKNISWKWGCTAVVFHRVTNLSMTETFFYHSQVFNFGSEKKGVIFPITKTLEKIKNEGYDSITVEINIIVLRHFGIPQQDSSFTNSDYQCLTETIEHTVENISCGFTIDRSVSKKIGNFECYVRILRVENSAVIGVHYDELKNRCVLEIEIRLYKQSIPNEFYSRRKLETTSNGRTVTVFPGFMDWDELINPDNHYVVDDKIKISAHIMFIFKK